jgi:glycosyltransferase involved in cell wall biosynthesis
MSHPDQSSLPTVSIGLPVFNGEKFLAEAVESLLSQTYSNIELIITDNASTDKTEEISRNFASRDIRIRYIRQQSNIGPGPNFKAALDAANGAYFMWAAYDDLWEANHVADAVELLGDPGVDFVFPTFALQSIKWRISKRFDSQIFAFVSSPDRRFRVLSFISTHYLSHSANIVYSLFRRDFVKKIWSIQDITNDGVFGVVAVSHGLGELNPSLFKKRYASLWPGQLQIFIAALLSLRRGVNVSTAAAEAIVKARQKLEQIFPEYTPEIADIFAAYKPFTYGKRYRVCRIPEKR